MRFNNFPIRTKLIVMLSLSAIIALSISFFASAYYMMNSKRDHYVHNLTQIAQITSQNIQASLTFDDEASAFKMLQPLHINPNISHAVIYTPHNKIFAYYLKKDTTKEEKNRVLGRKLQHLSKKISQYISWETISIVVPVSFDTEILGYLKIVSDTKEIQEEIKNQLLRLFLIGTLVLIVIVLVSLKLQKVFTSPIYNLLHIMKEVAINNNYNTTIRTNNNDEFKDLYAGFASMLETIKIQKDKIEYIHKQTKDSIEYSATIQKALLPEKEKMTPFFDDLFTIWKPKDTVGGDIYLFETLRHKDEALLMIIDCTGHGVPGAFVTMIVKAIEKEIVAKLIKSDFDINPAIIMQYFNKNMQLLLHQDHKESRSNAGFDGAIVYINKRKNILRYAGSNTPLFILQDDILEVIKSDKESIGYKRSNPAYQFTMHEIHIDKTTQVYLTTDGYLDQTGGKKGFLFGKKRFSTLIQTTYMKPYHEQKNLFEKTFLEYKKDNEIKDDRTLIAFHLNPYKKDKK